MREVEAEADAVELECELADVEIGAQLALVDGLLCDPRDAVEPRLLLLDEIVAQLAGPVVELDRRAEQRAPAVALLLRRPVEPGDEERSQTREPGAFAQRGHDHA